MGGHCTHHWIERLICQCFDASLQCIGSWSLVWVQQLIGNRWRQWQEGRHSRSCFQPWLPISTLSFTFFSLGFLPSQNTWRFVESSPNPIPNPASVAFWAASSQKPKSKKKSCSTLLPPWSPSLVALLAFSLGFSFLAMNDIILHRVVSFGITLYCILLHDIPLYCMPGPNKVVLFHSINSNTKNPDY